MSVMIFILLIALSLSSESTGTVIYHRYDDGSYQYIEEGHCYLLFVPFEYNGHTCYSYNLVKNGDDYEERDYYSTNCTKSEFSTNDNGDKVVPVKSDNTDFYYSFTDSKFDDFFVNIVFTFTPDCADYNQHVSNNYREPGSCYDHIDSQDGIDNTVSYKVSINDEENVGKAVVRLKYEGKGCSGNPTATTVVPCDKCNQLTAQDYSAYAIALCTFDSGASLTMMLLLVTVMLLL
ncbi:hypothetical protein EDI_306420 [Entamoeba dispar SAW760]|uniref:Uncharacterized protein n=1 Tax=Entamoeba dispar (strain ATCC PRA-260 / SAW760) TaxID=370354 RepID=B0EFQ6_ENTDS|nr:uncharacterized protein EDI_306420 [Entamoeba dispar SAW760]EDR26640.1 hypothetical protein EDI_306420 [Entamoeba dispar SAW760]|eukprot:EDR26640.1 hypothetical protein EDI_306420 [Entamoeba dispar SAW760]